MVPYENRLTIDAKIRLATAMLRLTPDMKMEDLWLAAYDLREKGMLDIDEEGFGFLDVHRKRFYVRNTPIVVLSMEAMPDYHTHCGYDPPKGRLHLYDVEGCEKEVVKISSASEKIWR